MTGNPLGFFRKKVFGAVRAIFGGLCGSFLAPDFSFPESQPLDLGEQATTILKEMIANEYWDRKST